MQLHLRRCLHFYHMWFPVFFFVYKQDSDGFLKELRMDYSVAFG